MTQRTKTQAPAHERHLVRNQSERRGPILAVAVHTTEGGTLGSVRNWFNNPASQASSHIGIGTNGETEQWVTSDRKAWTIGAANSWTLNIEFIGHADQPASAWREAQVKAGARWLAYWSLKYGIPIQKANCRNVNGQCVCTKKGVIRHSDVTAAGFGSHTDPGPAFPMDDFLRYARYYRKNGWTT